MFYQACVGIKNGTEIDTEICVETWIGNKFYIYAIVEQNVLSIGDMHNTHM